MGRVTKGRCDKGFFSAKGKIFYRQRRKHRAELKFNFWYPLRLTYRVNKWRDRLWLLSLLNRASARRILPVSTSALLSASILCQMRKASKKLSNYISIRMSASTAGLVSLSARWKPSSPRTKYPRSGSTTLRLTPSTSLNSSPARKVLSSRFDTRPELQTITADGPDCSSAFSVCRNLQSALAGFVLLLKISFTHDATRSRRFNASSS